MRAGTLRVSGGVLETGWWGPEPSHAPTLVLLHEGLGSVALWRDVPARLAAVTGWGVFAYSRFGYGNSDSTALPRPMTYLEDEALVVLPEVLQAAGIQRAVLVGHSDGGSIAAIYAGGASSVVSGAVAGPIEVLAGDGPPSMPSTAGHRVDSGLASAQTRSTNLVEPNKTGFSADTVNIRVQLLGLVTIAAHFVVEELNLLSIRQIKDEYETGALRQRLSRYHRDVDAAFRGWNDAWLDPHFQDFNITDFLPHIAVPILALQGADDPYGTDLQLRVLESHVAAPIHTQLIAAARHSPHLEAMEETLAAIANFIANLPRGSCT